MNQESDTFKHELHELKSIKERYTELTREHKSLTDEKAHLHKQYEKALQNKDSSLQESTRQHN